MVCGSKKCAPEVSSTECSNDRANVTVEELMIRLGTYRGHSCSYLLLFNIVASIAFSLGTTGTACTCFAITDTSYCYLYCLSLKLVVF